MRKIDIALEGMTRWSASGTSWLSMRCDKNGDYVSARRAAQKISALQAEIVTLRVALAKAQEAPHDPL